MKKLYSLILYPSLILASLFIGHHSMAQCPNGGTQGTTAYDTTIRFPTGATNMKVKFPKFNPTTGMVSCVKLVVTIIGVVDTVAMQNYSGSPQTATLSYDRSDNMTGPGLSPSISNSYDGDFGPYNLAAYDGTPNAGPDFFSRPKDTVLKKVMTRTINQADEISNFYGTDSVEYDYSITVSTSAAMTGGSSSNLVLTSALVNFRFEYCTCSMQVLPVGPSGFRITKTSANTAELRWEAENSEDLFYYEVEASRDGRSFKKVGRIEKSTASVRPSYRFAHKIKPNDFGRYFYRVKQRWTNGYFRYSDIKSIEFVNTLFTNVSIYPNPSSGNTGIKFVAARSGNYNIQVSNAAGQVVVRQEMRVKETDYKSLPALPKGTYYIKITEQETQTSTTQQLIIH